MLSRSGEDSTIQVPYIERADRALLPFLKQSHFVRFIKTNSTDLVEHGSRWVAKWSHPNARRKETLVELRRIALRSRDYRRAPPPPKGHLTTNGSGHGTESIIATNFTLQIYIDSGIRGGDDPIK